jgi:uncharacterized protein YutE (UPF0331/DUF86 family)
MADDVLINKAAVIERCVARARQEYAANSGTFATDFTRQDAAILNIQRACEAALDMGQHLIRREKLGVPQSARDVFALLVQGVDERHALTSAVYLHGAAADQLTEKGIGPIGLTAGEVIDAARGLLNRS